MYRFSDIRSLLFVAAGIALLVSGWALSPQGYLGVGWVVISSLFCLISCVVNHNHMHCKIFKDTRLNFVFELFLSFARGHTAATVFVPHNLNHHTHQGSDRDWISPAHVQQKQDIVNIFTYIIYSITTMNIERRKSKNAAPSHIRQQHLLQRIALYLMAFMMFVVKPLDTTLFVFLPWMIGACALVAVNLYQHAECNPEFIYKGSRNFTNWFENWIFFNNGYHTAHHLYPGVHWSDLPKVHKSIKDKIPDHLNQGSIITYGFKKAWPTRRDQVIGKARV